MLLIEGEPDEFNLQFTRLNVGLTINAGEKLNAMVGDMRNLCFTDPALGQHPFLDAVKIPTRRFAQEQVAAQIAAQAFSLRDKEGDFTPTRHVDLQRFFKAYARMNDDDRELVGEITRTLDAMVEVTAPRPGILRSRAIAVSAVLLAYQLRLSPGDPECERYGEFLELFLGRLKWQVSLGLDYSPQYRHLLDFQRDVTQASVEKRAVDGRQDALSEAYEHWNTHGNVVGDEDYVEAAGKEPQVA